MAQINRSIETERGVFETISWLTNELSTFTSEMSHVRQRFKYSGFHIFRFSHCFLVLLMSPEQRPIRPMDRRAVPAFSAAALNATLDDKEMHFLNHRRIRYRCYISHSPSSYSLHLCLPFSRGHTLSSTRQCSVKIVQSKGSGLWTPGSGILEWFFQPDSVWQRKETKPSEIAQSQSVLDSFPQKSILDKGEKKDEREKQRRGKNAQNPPTKQFDRTTFDKFNFVPGDFPYSLVGREAMKRIQGEEKVGQGDAKKATILSEKGGKELFGLSWCDDLTDTVRGAHKGILQPFCGSCLGLSWMASLLGLASHFLCHAWQVGGTTEGGGGGPFCLTKKENFSNGNVLLVTPSPLVWGKFPLSYHWVERVKLRWLSLDLRTTETVLTSFNFQVLVLIRGEVAWKLLSGWVKRMHM